MCSLTCGENMRIVVIPSYLNIKFDVLLKQILLGKLSVIRTLLYCRVFYYFSKNIGIYCIIYINLQIFQ